jgi:hypothetical protein
MTKTRIGLTVCLGLWMTLPEVAWAENKPAPKENRAGDKATDKAKAPAQGGGASEAEAKKAAPATAQVNCRLNSVASPPLRRSGTAHVRIQGDGLNVDVPNAPAVCGAYFLQDAQMLGRKIKAGEGIVFETCVPEGLLQVSAEQRTPGKQKLGGPGTTVLFNRQGGGSYMLRMSPGGGDTVSFGKELFSAKTQVTLKKMMAPETVKVDVTFTCP